MAQLVEWPPPAIPEIPVRIQSSAKIYILNIYLLTVNFIEKTKIKEKEAWNGPKTIHWFPSLKNVLRKSSDDDDDDDDNDNDNDDDDDDDDDNNDDNDNNDVETESVSATCQSC